jgi:hypothetical protein
MAGIRPGSGGLIGEATRTQPTYVPQTPQQQVEPEGLGSYAVRNIGGAAEGFGKGIQSLVQALLPQGTQQTSDQLMQLLGAPTLGQLNKSQGNREQALPPVEAILSDLGKPEGFGAPRNLTESALRFGLTEAPFIAASGGFGSLPAFGKAAAGSLGMLGGSQVGHAIGKEIGGERGGVIGGLVGGLGGSALTHAALNRPTSLSKNVYDANVKDFETKKLQRLRELESERLPEIERTGKKITSEKLNLAKEKSTFDRNVKDSVDKLTRNYKADLKKLEDARIAREAKIKELGNTKELYKQAKEARQLGKIKEPAPGLKSLLDEMEETYSIGTSPSEKKAIGRQLNEIKYHLRDGDLNLKYAVTLQKNLNTKLNKSKLFKERGEGNPAQSLPSIVEKAYAEIIYGEDGINEFIAKAGEKHPEHGDPFSQAEAMTAERGQLIQGTNRFNKEQTRQKQSLTRDYKEAKNKIEDTKFPEEQKIYSKERQNQLNDQLDILEKDYKTARNEIGKEAYDKFIKSDSQQNKFINWLENSYVGKKIDNWGLSALGMALAKVTGGGTYAYPVYVTAARLLRTAGREARYMKEVFKTHPEIFNEYISLFGQAMKHESPKLLTKIEALNNKAATLAKEEEKKEPKRSGIRPGTGGLL